MPFGAPPRLPWRRWLAIALVALGTAAVLTPAQPAGAATGAAVVLSQPSGSAPTGSVHAVTATATGSDGKPVPDGSTVTFTISGPEHAITVGAPVADLALTGDGRGVWILRGDGTVAAGGTAKAWGDADVAPVSAVAIAATPSGAGYWIATAAGRVLSFGDATSEGALSDPPAAPVVDIAAHPSGADTGW